MWKFSDQLQGILRYTSARLVTQTYLPSTLSTGGKSIEVRFNLTNQGQPYMSKPEIQMGWGRETWDRTKTQRNKSGANM